MRKLLLSLCALAAMTASAQTKQLVRIDSYSVTIDETGAETITFSNSGNINYYDKTNALVMDQNNYSRNFYSYNADGTVAAEESWGWSTNTGWALSSKSDYVYNEAGMPIKYGNFESGNYTEIGYDEKGGTISMVNYYGGAASYSVTYNNQYNEQGLLTISDQIMADGVTINQRTINTYNADGSLAKSETGYYVGEGEALNSPTINTYTYNTDGSIQKVRTVSSSRWGDFTTDNVYVYADFAAAYAPQNVKAAAGANNTVTVTWDAVEGASAYIVIYDQSTEQVTATSFTTGSLLDGEHQFFVQAVIGEEGRNIGDMAVASVKDTGKLPAEGFKVIGVEVGEDQWGSVAYNTTVQFTIPEGHSEITGYKLFYSDASSYSYVTLADVTIEGNTATATAALSTYNVGTYNYDTYEYDLGIVPLFAVITYASGDADASNIERWDFAANESSIASATLTSAPVAIYTVGGVKVAAPQKGINIVKMANGEVKKVIY